MVGGFAASYDKRSQLNASVSPQRGTQLRARIQRIAPGGRPHGAAIHVWSPLLDLEAWLRERVELLAPRAVVALFRAARRRTLVVEQARAHVAGVAGCGLTLVEADEHAKEVCFATMVAMLAA